METLLALGASNGVTMELQWSYKSSEIKLSGNSLGDWKEKGPCILSSQIFNESNAGPDSSVASFNLAALKKPQR